MQFLFSNWLEVNVIGGCWCHWWRWISLVEVDTIGGGGYHWWRWTPLAPVVCYGLRVSQLHLGLQNCAIVRQNCGTFDFSPTLWWGAVIFAQWCVDCSLHSWLVVVWSPDAVGWLHRNRCLLGQWAVTLITLVTLVTLATSVYLITKSVTLVTLKNSL